MFDPAYGNTYSPFLVGKTIESFMNYLFSIY